MPMCADQGEYTQFLTENGAAIDLVQIKTFERSAVLDPSVKFDRLYSGEVIVGTEEAIRAEMKDVFTRVRGAEGETMRGEMRRLRETARKSRESGGARQAMEALAEFF